MVLGSREQLCCNPDVQNLPPYAQQHNCKQLGPMCKYHRLLQGEHIHEIYYGNTLPNRGLMDIEDLYKYCSRKEVHLSFSIHSRFALISSHVIMWQ